MTVTTRGRIPPQARGAVPSPSMRAAWIALGALSACGSTEPPPAGAAPADVVALDVAAGDAPEVAPPPSDTPEPTVDTPDVINDAAGSFDVINDAAEVSDVASDPTDVPPGIDAAAPPSDRPDAALRDAQAPMDARLDAAPADASFSDVRDASARDVPAADVPAGAWRSALFPDDWRPLHAGGRADAMGRFLHDVSTAGYHRGDDAPPYRGGTVVRTVDAALGNGTADARAAIQAALDGACADATPGLRVVRLPAGTYRVRFPTPTPATDPALRIACSNLALRGEGPSRTRILLDDPTNARQRAVILVRGGGLSVWSGGATAALARDLPAGSTEVPLATVAGFNPGDLVSVRTELTDAFRADHRMNVTEMGETFWPPSANNGLLYPRRVLRVDAARRAITLDAPTRYPMKTRDNARVFYPTGFLREVGIQDLALGMREHPTSTSGTPGPLGDAADLGYSTPGTAAYAVHASAGLRFDGVTDAWIYNVETYAPTGNASGAHVLSNAMFLTQGTHRVTVEACRFQRPQYRGGGGNGYLFWNQGSDNLVRDVEAVNGRHNLIMAALACSGNVWLRARSTNARYSDDSHAGLAQANLYDNVTLDRAWLQAVNRGATSSGAGFTATATVFWNTRVVALHTATRRAPYADGVAVETAQFGWGYAIGSQGAGALATRSYTNSYWSSLDPGAPTDWVEGEGRGGTLFPPSLYEEQRRRRWLRGE